MAEESIYTTLHTKRLISESSDSSSFGEPPKRTKLYGPPSTTKLQMIKPTDVVCLYHKEDELPEYIKIGEKVMKCLKMTEKSEADIIPPLSLTKHQEKHKKCIFDCVDILLEGLKLKRHEGHSSFHYRWEDVNGSFPERYRKSKDVEKKFDQSAKISYCLSRFYESLINGFPNGIAGIGLMEIFMMCSNMFEGGVYADHIGGSCVPGYGGSIEIAKRFYQFDKGSTEEEERNQAITVLNSKEAEVIGLVPDVTLCKGLIKDTKFFMFAECKDMANEIQPQEIRKLWHQALRGLFNQDYVYGCLINGIKGEFLKLKVEDDTLETYYLPFDLSGFSGTGIGGKFFDVQTFKILLEFIISIIQAEIQEN